MLCEDTIIKEILPYLSEGSRGKSVKNKYLQIVQAILYKLKTGCQWALVPIKMFFDKPYSASSVYHHYRRWISDGSWKICYLKILEKYKSFLNLSSIELDGSQTVAKKGGEEVSYQGRKKAKTTNLLFLTDKSGLIVGFSNPISGKHNDQYKIEEKLDEAFSWLKKSNIPISGLFLNADAGFDSEKVREYLNLQGIIANIDIKKNRKKDESFDLYFDPKLYKERATCEHSFAWLDACRSVIIRYDILASCWLTMNLLGSLMIFLKRVYKKIKSKLKS
jgi:transposase